LGRNSVHGPVLRLAILARDARPMRCRSRYDVLRQHSSLGGDRIPRNTISAKIAASRCAADWQRDLERDDSTGFRLIESCSRRCLVFGTGLMEGIPGAKDTGGGYRGFPRAGACPQRGAESLPEKPLGTVRTARRWCRRWTREPGNCRAPSISPFRTGPIVVKGAEELRRVISREEREGRYTIHERHAVHSPIKGCCFGLLCDKVLRTNLGPGPRQRPSPPIREP